MKTFRQTAVKKKTFVYFANPKQETGVIKNSGPCKNRHDPGEKSCNREKDKKEKEMELIMLGTGNAMVTKCYNTCFALKNGDNYLLTDAGGGNGILVQLEKAGIPVTGIRHLFITHTHTDHILGAVWVIRKIASLMENRRYDKDFTVHAHDEAISVIQTLCRLTLGKKILKYFGGRILFHTVADKANFMAIGVSFTCFDIHSSKAKQFGFRAILPDRQILVCLGDEPYHPGNRKEVERCDWLLSEAFCLFSEKEKFKPYEKHHSTAKDAGRDAALLQVKNLVLYHTEDSRLTERKVLYAAEAATLFKGTIFVPDDLEVIELKQ